MPTVALLKPRPASEPEGDPKGRRVRLVLGVIAGLSLLVFLGSWFVPFEIDVAIFGDPDPPVAECPAPIHYVFSDTGFARDCDVTALTRVMLTSAVTFLLSYGSVLVWKIYGDLGAWRARRAAGTAPPLA